MPPTPQPSPTGTVLETDDEIAEHPQPIQPGNSWLAVMPLPRSLPAPAPASVVKAGHAPTVGAAPRGVVPYRSTIRPPMAFLTVCDAGGDGGEVIRIRANRFVVGRTEGDLLIPHDELISSRHAELTRQLVGGKFRWVVTDLQSTNGLFARVSRATLTDRAEFLVGAGRYRFEASIAPYVTTDHVSIDERGSTKGWGTEPSPLAPPALVELVPGGIGNRHVLTRAEYWIGTDPGCAVCRPDDPFCESRHVRLFRDSAGGWQAEHKKSLNGLWLRIPQIGSERGFVFQIGEQRFRLTVEG